MSPTSKTIIQSDASKKGGGGVLSVSVNRCQWSLQESKLHRVVSHQTISFNFFQNVQSQINPFPSRQYECPFVPDENGGYIKQDDSNLGIHIVQRDHDYYRVPSGQIESRGTLVFQKFPGLKRMATISKSIPRKFCKVGIARIGSFCI